jgi:hypothetical protein
MSSISLSKVTMLKSAKFQVGQREAAQPPWLRPLGAKGSHL